MTNQEIEGVLGSMIGLLDRLAGEVADFLDAGEAGGPFEPPYRAEQHAKAHVFRQDAATLRQAIEQFQTNRS